MRRLAALTALMLCAGCALTSPQAEPLERSDPHVAELFNVLRATRGAGGPVDMDKLDALIRIQLCTMYWACSVKSTTNTVAERLTQVPNKDRQ